MVLGIAHAIADELLAAEACCAPHDSGQRREELEYVLGIQLDLGSSQFTKGLLSISGERNPRAPKLSSTPFVI